LSDAIGQLIWGPRGIADKHVSNVDDNKKAMTIQSLLDMTSRIEWQERAYTPDETMAKWELHGETRNFRAQRCFGKGDPKAATNFGACIFGKRQLGTQPWML
jgi:hypothetical protein